MKTNDINRHKPKSWVIFTILGIVAWIAIRGYRAKNYLEPDLPYYSGNYAQKKPRAGKTITVVTYNIWFGKDIRQAISDLQEIQSQHGLDVLLLQEMDEAGTEQIARELKLNYAYYPAAIEPTYDKNFGNAVLSRWPITESKKLMLPHKSLSNRMSRTATEARIHIQHREIVVYSLHTESVFTLPRFRKDQYRAVLRDIDPESRLAIVGGDFNSFTRRAADTVAKDFGEAGFVRGSQGSPYSVKKIGIELATDHIFTKGFTVEDAGTGVQALASDHLPIWVKLRLQ